MLLLQDCLELDWGRYDIPGPKDQRHLITDPPFSDRTHQGVKVDRADRAGGMHRTGLAYGHWTETEMTTMLTRVEPALGLRSWRVVVTDHVLARVVEEVWRNLGLYVFPPIPHILTNAAPRMDGRGPPSKTVWVIVARAKLEYWGSVRGYYIGPRDKGRALRGGKERWFAEALVSDYSRKGDVIVDPCAGHGTFLVAAKKLNRHAFGCELDRGRCEVAREALKRQGVAPSPTEGRWVGLSEQAGERKTSASDGWPDLE